MKFQISCRSSTVSY